jgi:spermidine synthase
VREILKHKNIERITLVDLDAAMTTMFSTSAELTALNEHSLTDPRVKVVNADAGRWLETDSGMFDLIVSDFPDPSNFALGKLYSVPIYRWWRSI